MKGGFGPPFGFEETGDGSRDCRKSGVGGRGEQGAGEGLILSNAVRAGVIGFAKTLADEVGGDNILVNNVCPGYTLTHRLRALAGSVAARQGTTPEQVIRGWESRIPLGRLGSSEEFADLVVFLASERAGYITGATIQIDGGYFRGKICSIRG